MKKILFCLLLIAIVTGVYACSSGAADSKQTDDTQLKELQTQIEALQAKNSKEEAAIKQLKEQMGHDLGGSQIDGNQLTELQMQLENLKTKAKQEETEISALKEQTSLASNDWFNHIPEKPPLDWAGGVTFTSSISKGEAYIDIAVSTGNKLDTIDLTGTKINYFHIKRKDFAKELHRNGYDDTIPLDNFEVNFCFGKRSACAQDNPAFKAAYPDACTVGHSAKIHSNCSEYAAKEKYKDFLLVALEVAQDALGKHTCWYPVNGAMASHSCHHKKWHFQKDIASWAIDLTTAQ